MTINSIVVGVDGSQSAYRAFAMAIDLAEREHGRVHACCVAHVPALAAAGSFVTPTPPLDDRLDDDLSNFVTDALSRAHVSGDFAWRVGEIAVELESLAADHAADLIVVGRSAHLHLRVGGVPRHLLARGHYPILVVP